MIRRLWLAPSVLLALVGCRPSEDVSPAADTQAAGRNESNSPPNVVETGDSRPANCRGCPLLSADYFPLVSGTQLEYAVTYKLPYVPERQAIARTSIRTPRMVDGHEYYPVVTEFSGTPIAPNNSFLCRLTEGGIYHRPLENPASATESLLMPTQLSPGTSWTVDRGEVAADIHVVASESLECHGTTYDDCVHLAGKARNGGELERWLARGVGLVRADMRHGDVTIRLQLVKRVSSLPDR
jgi:hypothetical protein